MAQLDAFCFQDDEGTRCTKTTTYSPEQWEAKRPLITHLYTNERRTLAQVTEHLYSFGFYVK